MSEAMAVHCLDGVDLESWQGQWRGAALKRYPVAADPSKGAEPLTSGAETYETHSPYVRFAFRRPVMWNFARQCETCMLTFKSLDEFVMHMLVHDNEVVLSPIESYVIGLIADLPGIDRSTIRDFIYEEYGIKLTIERLEEHLKLLRQCSYIRREGRGPAAPYLPL